MSSCSQEHFSPFTSTCQEAQPSFFGQMMIILTPAPSKHFKLGWAPFFCSSLKLEIIARTSALLQSFRADHNIRAPTGEEFYLFLVHEKNYKIKGWHDATPISSRHNLHREPWKMANPRHPVLPMLFLACSVTLRWKRPQKGAEIIENFLGILVHQWWMSGNLHAVAAIKAAKTK